MSRGRMLLLLLVAGLFVACTATTFTTITIGRPRRCPPEPEACPPEQAP